MGKLISKEKVFILASCMELALGLMGMCQYEIPIKRFVLWGFFCVYLMEVCTNYYSRKEKGVLMVCIFIGILLYVNSGINTGIKAPVYIAALKKIDIKRLLKWMLVTMCMMTVGIIAASLVFNFGNLSIYDYREDGFFKGIRYSLGFANPNVLQFLIFVMFSYYLLLYGRKISLKQYTALGLVFFLFFSLTYSKTGFAIGISVFIAAIVMHLVRWQKWCKFWLIMFVIEIAIFLIISFSAAMQLNGSIMEVINEIISGRMDQLWHYTNGKQYLLPYIDSWRMFSARINKNVYDMGYIQMFYYYGIIPACCYLMFLFYSMYCAAKQKNEYGCLVLAGLSCYLFMESLFFSNYLTMDFLLMSAAMCVWGIRPCKMLL